MEPTINTTSPHSRFVHSVLAILVVGLLALSAVLLVQYQDVKEKFSGTSEVKYTSENTRVLQFLDDLVNIVLGSTVEISLEDRLRLENEVRALNDKDILTTWKNFTEASSDTDAQVEVIKLLRFLVNKLKET